MGADLDEEEVVVAANGFLDFGDLEAVASFFDCCRCYDHCYIGGDGCVGFLVQGGNYRTPRDDDDEDVVAAYEVDSGDDEDIVVVGDAADCADNHLDVFVFLVSVPLLPTVLFLLVAFDFHVHSSWQVHVHTSQCSCFHSQPGGSDHAYVLPC